MSETPTAPVVPAKPAWTPPPDRVAARAPAAGCLDIDAVLAVLRATLPAVGEGKADNGVRWITVPATDWPAAARLLRDDARLRFDSLQCLSGIDLSAFAPPAAPKAPAKPAAGAPPVAAPAPAFPGDLAIACHLHSFTHGHLLALRVYTTRGEASIPSVSAVWPVANYFEREVWDLFGIRFPGHPRLDRIMCPDDWVGHPLRKDYAYPESYNGVRLRRAGQHFEDGPYADAPPAPTPKAAS